MKFVYFDISFCKMINDFDVILYYLMGGIEVNRCMERERESFFVFFFKVKLGILLI